MRVLERRFDVDLIDPLTLRRYMKWRGQPGKPMSLQQLANAVTAQGVKTSKATIGHLVSGHVKRTSDDRALAIAQVLDVPHEVLFSNPSVSIVQRDVKPRKVVA